MGKSTISTGLCSIAMLNYQRVIFHEPEMLGHFGMIPLINHDSRLRSQWVRYNLPRSHSLYSMEKHQTRETGSVYKIEKPGNFEENKNIIKFTSWKWYFYRFEDRYIHTMHSARGLEENQNPTLSRTRLAWLVVFNNPVNIRQMQ